MAGPGIANVPSLDDLAREARPLLRGVLHAYAFWVALAAAVVLVVLAPEALSRVAASIYGLGLCALFAFSALYHRWRGHPRWRPLLRQLDHGTIYLFIAASSTPVALLVLSDPLRLVVLLAVWTGALGGIALSVLWIDAPRWVATASYLVVGWAALVGVPQIVERLPVAPLLLLLAGAVVYTLGAVVYALRRPDPWPRVFGFHEVFHGLVIAAAAAHFAALAGWVVPGAGA